MPPQVKLAAAVLAMVVAFGAGWVANGWRLGLVLAEGERDLATSKAETAKKTLEVERLDVERAAAIADRYEAERAAQEAEARVIVKEVIKYEKAPYAGRCQLPAHWVRIDAESALGLPENSTTSGRADGAPSGFTDVDALQVVSERNRICRAEIKKLELLQDYVRGLPGVSNLNQ